MLPLTEATDRLRTLLFELAAAGRRLDLLAEAATEDPALLAEARVAYAVLSESVGELAAEAAPLAQAIRAGLNLQPEGEQEHMTTDDGLPVCEVN